MQIISIFLAPQCFFFWAKFLHCRENKTSGDQGHTKDFLLGKKGKITTTFEGKKCLKSPYLDTRFSEFPKNIAGFQKQKSTVSSSHLS
jgi:hypothetical protein